MGKMSMKDNNKYQLEEQSLVSDILNKSSEYHQMASSGGEG